eukprot:scaffold1435_cov267-Pinguiococcus_pyrenoidosus.AAC.4
MDALVGAISLPTCVTDASSPHGKARESCPQAGYESDRDQHRRFRVEMLCGDWFIMPACLPSLPTEDEGRNERRTSECSALRQTTRRGRSMDIG